VDYHTSEHKNSDGFTALIELIVAQYCPGETYNSPKIGLVIDNYYSSQQEDSSSFGADEQIASTGLQR
jgi:hypothetical protein